MASTSVTYNLSVRTGMAIAAIRTLGIIAPLLVLAFGPERVLAFAEGVARRLILWRFDDGRWRLGL